MSLAKKAAGGLFWSTAGSLGSRVFTIISTFILTRYLAPEVQGEVNLAYVLVSTGSSATAFGVMQYIAARPKEGRETAFHGNVLVLGGGLVACLLCVVSSGTVAKLLGVPGMQQYVAGMALAHYIERLGWLPRSLLVRDMRFRTSGARVALGELTFAVSSVTLAHLGWGGNSIVGGNLLRSVVGTCFLFAVTNWRDHLQPCRLAWETMARLLRFGLPFTIAGFFHFGATYWDNMFVGARFGEGAVGVYNQAYRLAELPATTVGDQVTDVLVPTFARVEDPEARRRGFIRATQLIAVLIFPMSTGLAAIAPTLVEVCYPKSYGGVAPFLVVLASISIARSFGNLAGAFLQVVGRTRGFVLIDFALAASMLVFMALLAPFGAVVSSAGVGVAFMTSLLLTLRMLLPNGITVRAVLAAAARPFAACLPLVAAVLLLHLTLEPAGLPAALRLVIELLGGTVAYVAGSFLIAPSITRDFLDLAKGIVRRKATPKTEKKEDPATPAS